MFGNSPHILGQIYHFFQKVIIIQTHFVVVPTALLVLFMLQDPSFVSGPYFTNLLPADAPVQ
jgi:hypothetical protein